EGGERLRLLAVRQLVRLAEAAAEGELCVHAVDAGDVRVADERGAAVAGDELAEASERARLDVHAGGREDDVVGGARGGGWCFLVERSALLVQARELVAVARERAIACLHALPAGVERLVEPDGCRVLAQEASRALGADGAATELDHLRRRRRED